jgi:hypothetical protein
MDFRKLFGAKPAAQPSGGLLGNALQATQSRPYQLHVQEAKAMGETPMTPEEFARQQQPRGLLGQ